MRKLNITKEQFNRSRYFKNKYGTLEYVSESGKVFKTNKGNVLKFKESRKIVKESADDLATPENVKVGDILYCTSYYDFQIQTFYKVLAKRGTSTLVVQRVEKEYDGTQSDGVVTPSDKVDSRYKPITVRYGKRGFKVGNDKLYIWDGSPLEEYNYSESNKKFGSKFNEDKEESSRNDELIKQALETAIHAKKLLDEAASTIYDAVGETYLFTRLDSHSNDLDETIDDIKGVLNGTVDLDDYEYVPESGKGRR